MPESTLLRLVKSRRLNLIATTTELLKKDIAGSEYLAEALGVAAPDSWPPDLYGPSAMRYALEQLGDSTEQCWSFWYLTTPDEPGWLVFVVSKAGRTHRDRLKSDIRYWSSSGVKAWHPKLSRAWLAGRLHITTSVK